MNFGPGVPDATLQSHDDLPTAHLTPTEGAALDLGPLSEHGIRFELMEMQLTAPALNAVQLPDTETVTYKIQVSDSPTFSPAIDLIPAAIIQTGAAGSGTPPKTSKFKVPSHCQRYMRAVATSSTNAGDCSGAKMTLSILL